MDDVLRVATELYYEWERAALPVRAGVISLLLGFPIAWIIETVRYSLLLGRRDRVHLAPVHVHGPPLDALGSQGVALALRGELENIRQSRRMLADQPAPYVAPATGRDQRYYIVGLRRDIPLPSDIGNAPELPTVAQEITLELGSVKIPVSNLANLLITLLGAVFIPNRNLYRRSLIRVSMVAHQGQVRLTVHLTGDRYAAERPRWWRLTTFDGWIRKAVNSLARRDVLAPPTAPPERAVLSETREATDLTQVADLLRDAAFMVLTLHDGDTLDWLSNRRLIDGLDALGDYRRRGDGAARTAARDAFREAAAADPEHNHNALYFHGMMTMVDRNSQAIDEARLHFEAALRGATHKPLQALVHSGLAYCHAQSVHRLAIRAGEALRKARDHAQQAECFWRAAYQHGDLPGELYPHPLIPYTYGLVLGVNESPAPDSEGRTLSERMTMACGYFHRAVELERDNGMFYNNVGWTLLKLLHDGVETVPATLELSRVLGAPAEPPAWVKEANWETLDPAPRDASTVTTAVTAEAYLRFALRLQPGNKLTHANLCLLYSLMPYREERDQYYARAVYHGYKALDLDPEYINGHRDFAIALLRYGELEPAREQYYEALALADDPDKDREIMEDVLRELDEHFPDLSAEDRAEWAEPDFELFLPRARGARVEEPETPSPA